MKNKVDAMELPFRLTRFLSFISLFLILVSSIGLAFFIGQTANETLLSRQKEYSKFIAENLNQQIYRRFTLPTYLAYGRIALQHPAQYTRLEEVVNASIVGQNVYKLKIYDQVKTIAFSLDKNDVGQENKAPESIESVFKSGNPLFEIEGEISHLKALFGYNLPDKSFLLHTVYPLQIADPSYSSNEENDAVLGVLELTQDITKDYETAIRFQWIILLTCVGSSFVLYAILQFFIGRAETILSERMIRTRKLEAELNQNERLASMGRVISSIAHEVRNPLGIIRSSSELLLKRSSAEDKRILSAIYDESCRLSRTVNDFLDYARPRLPKQQNVDLAKTIELVVGFLESEISNKNIIVQVNLDSELFVSGDKDLLYRAIYNVISNSIQAFDLKAQDKYIKIYGHNFNGYVNLDFQDSGSGFGAEIIDSVLDPFFTTKDNGTGLGLPIVSTILASHNGQIKLKNNDDGIGATVSFIIPSININNIED